MRGLAPRRDLSRKRDCRIEPENDSLRNRSKGEEQMMPEFPVVDPNNVPETLAAGLINFATQGPLAVLTFTHTRASIADLVVGKEKPDHAFVVVARVAMPLATARDLRDLLNKVITDNEAEPAVASTGTKH
jgi:hypothetical protein